MMPQNESSETVWDVFSAMSNESVQMLAYNYFDNDNSKSRQALANVDKAVQTDEQCNMCFATSTSLLRSYFKSVSSSPYGFNVVILIFLVYSALLYRYDCFSNRIQYD